jgi:hypothetical protein
VKSDAEIQIADDLEAALAQFTKIAARLAKDGS